MVVVGLFSVVFTCARASGGVVTLGSGARRGDVMYGGCLYCGWSDLAGPLPEYLCVGVDGLFGDKGAIFSFRMFPPGGASPVRSICNGLRRVSTLGPSFVDMACDTNNDNSGDHAYRVTAGVGESFKIRSITRLAYVGDAGTSVSYGLTLFGRGNVRGVLTLHNSEIRNIRPRGSFACTDSLYECVTSRNGFSVTNTYCPRIRDRTASRIRSVRGLHGGIRSNTDRLVSRLFFSGSICCHFLRETGVTNIGIPVRTNVVPMADGDRVREVISVYNTDLPTGFTGVVRGCSAEPRTLHSTNVTCTISRVISLVTRNISNVRLCAVGGPCITEGVARTISDLL